METVKDGDGSIFSLIAYSHFKQDNHKQKKNRTVPIFQEVA